VRELYSTRDASSRRSMRLAVPTRISKMERRSGMYLSTLRKIIQAMGGELDLIAQMPDGPVRIEQFNQLRAARKP